MTRYTAEEIAGFMQKAGFADVQVSYKENLFCVVGKKMSQATKPQKRRTEILLQH